MFLISEYAHQYCQILYFWGFLNSKVQKSTLCQFWNFNDKNRLQLNLKVSLGINQKPLTICGINQKHIPYQSRSFIFSFFEHVYAQRELNR